MSAQSLEFHLEEYRSLRAELMAAQAERRLVDRFGAAGLIAIYAWLLTGGAAAPAALYALSWLLPVAAALTCLLLSRRLTAGIRTAGVYLGAIERRYADPALLGWHETLSAIRATGAAPQPDAAIRARIETAASLDRVSGLSALFWRACLGVSLLLALIMIGMVARVWAWP